MTQRTPEPEWLDGPRLVTWLQGHGLFSSRLQLGNLARRISDWKAGGAAHVFTVDKVLTKLGLHLSEVPDDFWRTDSPQQERGQRMKAAA